MNEKKTLMNYEKKNISVEELASLLKFSLTDVSEAYEKIEALISDGIIEPVKASGKNGNLTYSWYKKYRITIAEEIDEGVLKSIRSLNPILLSNGYLPSHPSVYMKNKDVIDGINKYLFSKQEDEFISRKERSFEIFGKEKVLDDSGVKSLLKSLQITDEKLGFYDTPEYCFHDYIPVRKNQMTLLVCENKDIWFNIRRCMFEDGFKKLFGVPIDGVVYGSGNKVSQKQGALIEYIKFMGNPQVSFWYWGDIDREGFDIYRRTCEVNVGLDITLFWPGYKKMIERAKEIELEDSPSSKKEGMNFEDLFDGFNLEEKAYLIKMLKGNKLIPQEIISYKLLSEG